jgi:hypothetical protein
MNDNDPVQAKFPALKEKYPEDIERIEADEKAVTEILQKAAFYDRPEAQALLAACRRDVTVARLKLATDRTLIDNPDAQRELWAIIDARQWFIERAAQNYKAELDAIDRELDAELRKG